MAVRKKSVKKKSARKSTRSNSNVVKAQASHKTSARSSRVPTGAKVISVVYYLFAVAFLVGGIGVFIGSSILSQVLESLGPFAAVAGTVAGTVLILLSILHFFIARGLWTGANWARIVAIIFAAIGVASSLSSIITGNFGSIVTLAIHLIVGGYLLLNKRVKATFN